ncbi:uncharacterized protein KY384_005058 [Bacidia gigantensis]|uniref:uncharacterized protein n=1 Tax=Bacidia gigantensis TaxID=2732470 RepID=UPI001D03731C|nr:uncharacterized protein KY384_005058 [Bacidia gigantensis]KAG8530555.1 hypothetical protein KY384_005058 [Bacidia gigantensis]
MLVPPHLLPFLLLPLHALTAPSPSDLAASDANNESTNTKVPLAKRYAISIHPLNSTNALADTEPLNATNSSIVGIATQYKQWGVHGSCGQVSADTDFVAALSTEWNVGSHCWENMTVQSAGRSVQVTVADTCVGCVREEIDLSVAAFQELLGEREAKDGRVDCAWRLLGFDDGTA